MARPLKTGLDYFPFDTDFFSNQKIKRLRAKYGTKGITVYLYLLCEIYKEGYQVPYTEDLILDISDEFHLSENATREIVDYLLCRRLFEPELAKSVKVLTSKSIQSRWQAAKKGGSRKVAVEGRTWLLLPEETYTFLEVRPNENKSPENPSFSGINPSKSPENAQSKVKESKEKESKGNESKVDQSKVDQSKVDQSKIKKMKLNESRPDQSQREENDMESIASAISGAMTGLAGLAEKNNFYFSADKADYPEDEVNYPNPFRF